MLRGSSFTIPLAITLCDRLSEIEIGLQNSRYALCYTNATKNNSNSKHYDYYYFDRNIPHSSTSHG
jgi:hypothetical protein